MKKKFLSLFILCVASLSLMSCGKSNQSFSNAGDSIETAIPMEDTSLTNLAPIGKWVKTTAVSINANMDYETIYIRVNKVSSAEQDPNYIKECIETNNNLAEYEWWELDEDDMPGMNVVDWEIYVPEEFSAVKNGVVSCVTDDFDAVDFGDKRLPSFDLNCLSPMLKNNSNDDEDIPAGEIYQLRSYYYNKENKEYCFRNHAKPEGTHYDADADYVNAYFAVE